MLKKAKSFIKNYLLDRKTYKFFIRDWISLSDLNSASQVLATMRFSQNITPLQKNGVNTKRILIIAPHPDDESIGPGGTVLKALKKGAEVLVVYLTCGTAKTAKALQSEVHQISELYGYQTIFFDHYSKNIPMDDAFILRFSEIINDFKPETLFLPFFLDDHDDHRRASHLLLLAQNKGLLKNNFEVWAYQVYSVLPPNVIVDISDIISEKEKFIKLWKTQNKTRDWSHFALGVNAFNQRFLNNAPYPRYAESFFVLPARDYLNYCSQYFKSPSDCYYVNCYKENMSL